MLRSVVSLLRLSIAVSAPLGMLSIAALAHAAPPPLEPIEIERTVDFDLPDGVVLVDEPRVDLTPDEEHLAIGVEVKGADHVGITDLEGRNYRCLTCGHVETALKPELFHDGKRLWFADQSGQSSGGTGDFQWSILECAPSILACESATVLPVTFPRDSLAQGAQNREARPDVGGKYVGWNEVRAEEGTRMSIARLVRGDRGYSLVDTRVWNPQFTLSDSADDWEHGGRFYEGGSPVLGNRRLKYGSTRTAANYEIFELDLLTGKRRALTTDLDYNEVASYSPDGRSVWYTSARGLDRADVVTQLVRPSFIDMVSFGQLGRVFLFQNRRCMNEGWLMDHETGQHLGGYAGQPVLLEDDWNLRRFAWFADGTRAVTYEQRLPNRVEPTGADARRRVRIVRLPARTPTTPLEAIDLDETMMRALTVSASEYQGMAMKQVNGRVVPGRASGTATMTFRGTFAGGAWEVRFDGYSDDGKTFVSGTESLTTPNPIVQATWSADLVATGEHPGYLRGKIDVMPQNRFSGKVESEVDGRHLKGIPKQADCPGLRQPELTARVVRRKARRGGRMDLHVKVTSLVPEDAEARPVVHVDVEARRFTKGKRPKSARRGPLRVTGRTAADGTIRLIVRRIPDAQYVVRASAGGFKPSETRVSAIRVKRR